MWPFTRSARSFTDPALDQEIRETWDRVKNTPYTALLPDKYEKKQNKQRLRHLRWYLKLCEERDYRRCGRGRYEP